MNLKDEYFHNEVVLVISLSFRQLWFILVVLYHPNDVILLLQEFLMLC